MVAAAELAARSLRRCRECGQVKLIIPDAAREQLREELRASGEDPSALDRCLTCEQHAAIRAAKDAGKILSLDEFETVLSYGSSSS